MTIARSVADVITEIVDDTSMLELNVFSENLEEAVVGWEAYPKVCVK